MALRKQNIPVSFDKGINTKTDEKQLQAGQLSVLENGVFETIGKLSVRNGYDALVNETLGGSSISNARAISSIDDELALYTNTKLYTYSSSLQKWAEKDAFSNVTADSVDIIRNNYQQNWQQAYEVSNIQVFAWEDGRGGVRATIRDRLTGTFFSADTELTSSGEKPKLAAIGNYVFIFYSDSTDLKYRRVAITEPDTIEPEQTVVSDLNTSQVVFDVKDIGTRVFIAYHSSAGTSSLSLLNIQEDGTKSSVINKSGETPTVCINVESDSSSRAVISYYDTSDVKVMVYSFNLSSEILAPTSVESISNCTNITSIESSNNTYTFFYEISASNTYDHLIKKNTVDTSGTVGTAEVQTRSAGLGSRAFSVDGDIYYMAIHENTLQATYFILNSDNKIIAQSLPSNAGTLLAASSLPNATSISSDKILIAAQKKGRLISDNRELFSVLGVSGLEFDFSPQANIKDKALQNNLHIAGGLLQNYDGEHVTEHGFLLYPEGLADGGAAGSGGSMSDGDYSYVAVYAWTDAKGNRHRSAPSPALSVTLSGGGSSQTQDVEVPSLRITEKENVIIELYRTEASGSVFYKVTSTTSPEFNNKAVDSITITDTLSDSDLIDNELLYTTGNILDNIAPEQARFIEEVNERLFLVVNNNKIQYSKEQVGGNGIEFNDLLTIDINQAGGAITGIKRMDEKLVIFKKSAILYIAGNGPNNAGQENDLTDPELVSSDIGCVDPASIVYFAKGIMFKSEKGIWLLSRNLSLDFIGSPVDAIDSVTITGAESVPNTNQIRFLASNGATLVYDYLVGQWSTFTNHRGLDSQIHDNTYYYLRPSGEVYQETPDQYTDNGQPIYFTLETGWISFAGLNGFQRVYRFLATANYKSPHFMRVKAAYDFVNAFINTKTIDSDNFIDTTAYGEESPYGSGAKYGGSGNRYNIRFDMKKQKCSSVKIRLECLPKPKYGQGIDLSALTFRVGGKDGLFKEAKSRSFGLG